MTHTILQPEGWPRPSGYANGVLARGRFLFVAGQIGWSRDRQFETDDLAGQVRQTLQNILAILAAANAGPQHLTSMTWYVTDFGEYLAHLESVGAVYRELMGRHYPAMTAVQVVALIEPRAKVEIQAIAVLPD